MSVLWNSPHVESAKRNYYALITDLKNNQKIHQRKNGDLHTEIVRDVFDADVVWEFDATASAKRRVRIDSLRTNHLIVAFDQAEKVVDEFAWKYAHIKVFHNISGNCANETCVSFKFLTFEIWNIIEPDYYVSYSEMKELMENYVSRWNYKLNT